MILTCPDCATSYFVDDERIPAQGRTVKCSSCGARWKALPEQPQDDEGGLDLDFLPRSAPPPAAEPEPEPVAASEAEAEPAPAPEPGLALDDLDIVAAPAEPVRPARRAAPQPKPGRTRAVALASGAVLVIVVLAAAIMFRNAVVRMAPPAAAVYAAVGLPVDRLGLVIEQVNSKAVLEAGRPVLSVTGVVRNTRGEPVQAPPIRVALLDKAGEPVAGKIAQPLNGRIPPGARRYFAIALPDPPAGSHELEVAFEAAEGGAHVDGAAHSAAAGAHAPATHAAEPVEAQPLPSGSPDALEKHG